MAPVPPPRTQTGSLLQHSSTQCRKSPQPPAPCRRSRLAGPSRAGGAVGAQEHVHAGRQVRFGRVRLRTAAEHHPRVGLRSEEHTSELQSLMRISYAVFCLQKKKTNKKSNID